MVFARLTHHTHTFRQSKDKGTTHSCSGGALTHERTVCRKSFTLLWVPNWQIAVNEEAGFLNQGPHVKTGYPCMSLLIFVLELSNKKSHWLVLPPVPEFPSECRSVLQTLVLNAQAGFWQRFTWKRRLVQLSRGCDRAAEDGGFSSDELPMWCSAIPDPRGNKCAELFLMFKWWTKWPAMFHGLVGFFRVLSGSLVIPVVILYTDLSKKGT